MVAIVAGTGTAVTAAAGGAYRVEKTGVTSYYDASARSAIGIAGDFVLRVRDVGAPNAAIVGVNSVPAASDGYADIERSLQFYNSTIYIYESGIYVPPQLTYADTVWIVRTTGILRYHVGAEATPETVVRTVTGVGGTLYFDCSISKPGGAIEASFVATGAAARRRPRVRLSLVL